MSTRVAILAIALMPPATWALDRPVATPYDHRVRTVVYNPHDVIQIDTVIGIATLIELERGEKFVAPAFGDSAAYDLFQDGDRVVLKPKAQQANTNLIILTDRRTYAFRLSYSDRRESRALYKLKIVYPDTQREADRLAAAKRAVDESLAASPAVRNWRGYTMSGDSSVAPVHAWDDGSSTWLQFKPGQDLPVAYMVDRDGQEVIVDRHMANGQTIVLHRVAETWRLRLGNQVLAVHNEAVETSPVDNLGSGTVTPEVRRIIREEPPK